jgi:hypothetical protein
MFVGRSGFSRDPCVIENQGFRVTEAAFTATPASSKAEVRGESPSYRDRLFVGAALAATLCVIENQGFGVYRSVFRCDPCVIEGGGSGRKPLLQKPSFCRSGFSRDSCAIENRDLGVAEAIFTATLTPSKAEVRDGRSRLFLSEDRRWGGRQLRAVALLEPHRATRGGWSLSLSDH